MDGQDGEGKVLIDCPCLWKDDDLLLAKEGERNDGKVKKDEK